NQDDHLAPVNGRNSNQLKWARNQPSKAGREAMPTATALIMILSRWSSAMRGFYFATCCNSISLKRTATATCIDAGYNITGPVFHLCPFDHERFVSVVCFLKRSRGDALVGCVGITFLKHASPPAMPNGR